ncbi:tetraacyldisaccharide 4'-kinase [Fluviispira sanaruensis]|uniref:Tetraacyldisaccharide 4'-kinase n=1 Tax=Fluviispira sanaruensis TaxID=2493639 RepID=A0A4P2VXN7_FLUSA|nr:tetraacyldisaccharide 4'-kinase [Fluviispira sanaruensis]BBH54415.1 tetraacyldisaccharide 4'-kinase [Fluviispira sanaruensis]
MSESFGQKIRNILDKSLLEKGLFFLYLSPIFFLLSYFIYLVARKRRYNGYNRLDEYNLDAAKIKIICVGNILIGGSGKSPVVQKIALEYLAKGWNVAIAARGIGANIKSVYISSTSPSEINQLSDENREHFEILSNLKSNNSNVFYILQNKKRKESLHYLIQDLNSNKWKENNTLLLLDDGLQHFACPRNVNLCLWSPYLLLNSPSFAMPIGPYREGFGNNSFTTLLESFDFRLWSRTQEEQNIEFKNTIQNSLMKHNILPNDKDIILNYQIFFWEISIINHNIRLKEQISQEDVFTKYSKFTQSLLITGIAHPKIFFSDLSFILKNKNVDYIFLNDHGNLSDSNYKSIQKSDFIIMTLKDLFRWGNDPLFTESIKDKNILTCSVGIKFLKYDSLQTLSISQLLSLKE